MRRTGSVSPANQNILYRCFFPPYPFVLLSIIISKVPSSQLEPPAHPAPRCAALWPPLLLRDLPRRALGREQPCCTTYLLRAPPERSRLRSLLAHAVPPLGSAPRRCSSCASARAPPLGGLRAGAAARAYAAPLPRASPTPDSSPHRVAQGAHAGGGAACEGRRRGR